MVMEKKELKKSVKGRLLLKEYAKKDALRGDCY
jgi:hypothetical protein